jgi:hypothetical protein
MATGPFREASSGEIPSSRGSGAFKITWHMKRDRFWLLLSSAWLLAAIGLIVLFI